MAYIKGTSETRNSCPLPPYNATNFNSANPTILAIMQRNASTQPQYPLPVGSNQSQMKQYAQNVSYFNGLNQQTQAIKTQNVTTGSNAPYPQFKSQSERIMYLQAQTLTAARNKITGQNPSLPAGVPCKSIYGIINS
jgi:hypothetical protein